MSVVRGLLGIWRIYTRRTEGLSSDGETISFRDRASRSGASAARRSMGPTVGTQRPSTATELSIGAVRVLRLAVPSHRRGVLELPLRTRLDQFCGEMNHRSQTDSLPAA